MSSPRYACICARFALIDIQENAGTERWNSGRTRNSFHSRSRYTPSSSMNRETGPFDNIPSPARWVLTTIGTLYIYTYVHFYNSRDCTLETSINDPRSIYIERTRFLTIPLIPAFRIVYYVTPRSPRKEPLIECYVSSIFLVNRKVVVKTACVTRAPSFFHCKTIL